MRKLIYAINLTLDGCFDHTNLVAGNDLCELADVHLDEATSDDGREHAAEDTRSPALSERGWSGSDPASAFRARRPTRGGRP